MQRWDYSRDQAWQQPPPAAVIVCPQCYGPVHRIPRRLIDRMISVISPKYRFQCDSWECGWEGNLPAIPAPRRPFS